MTADPRRLAKALGREFREPGLLVQALKHRSAGIGHNERLEFFGDALLGFVIAEALWERFPEADEGRLSRLRAALVKKESLARIAREIQLGDYLRLGAGELRTGGFTRDSILADTLEAVFAAVYLDQGFAASRETILNLFQGSLDQVADLGPTKDFKTRLQELLQADGRPLPEYRVMSITGSQHDQTFLVRCTIGGGERTADGRGTSRRRAEQHAAGQMLEQLGSPA